MGAEPQLRVSLNWEASSRDRALPTLHHRRPITPGILTASWLLLPATNRVSPRVWPLYNLCSSRSRLQVSLLSALCSWVSLRVPASLWNLLLAMPNVTVELSASVGD